MTTCKAMDTETLRRLNRSAVRTKRNRTIHHDAISRLDPEGIHLVAWSMVHNDREMRCLILMKFTNDLEPHEAYLDIAFRDYNRLGIISDGDLQESA